jgi:hypothetical protein
MRFSAILLGVATLAVPAFAGDIRKSEVRDSWCDFAVYKPDAERCSSANTISYCRAGIWQILHVCPENYICSSTQAFPRCVKYDRDGPETHDDPWVRPPDSEYISS